MVVTIKEQQFNELKRTLSRPNTPQSNCILSAMTNVEQGRVRATFHADKWPDVSAVVCQIFQPRLSDVADLICYASNSEALLKVLKEGKLITWGRRQTLEQVDRRHALYLMEHLKPPLPNPAQEDDNRVGFMSVFEGSLFYLPDEVPLGSENRECPPGFSIKSLQAEHSAIIASNWGGKRTFKDWPNFASFFEGMRENLDSVGVYTDNDGDFPVATGIQFACGRLGSLFTDEDYRRKGLATLIMQALAQQSRNVGLVPECNVGFGNPNRKLVTRLGFVECEHYKPNRLIVVSDHC